MSAAPSFPRPVPNAFRGRCQVCGARLAARSGRVRPSDDPARPWRLTCERCWPDTAPAPHVEERIASCPTIRQHQRDGVRWLGHRWSALLADEMGLGKSLQVLLAIPPGAPVLIVCPVGVMGTWEAEVARWRPELRTRRLAPGGWQWPTADDVAIVSYESTVDLDSVEAPPAGLVLICDEAHKAKNPRTGITKRARKLAGAALDAGGRAWMLTATPDLNRAREVYELLRCARLAVPAFGSAAAFHDHFPQGDDRRPPRDPKAFGDALSPYVLQRLKSDSATDLPPKSVDVRTVEIDDAARAEVAEHMRRLAALRIAREEVEAGKLADPSDRNCAAEVRKRLRKRFDDRVDELAGKPREGETDDVEELLSWAVDNAKGVSGGDLFEILARLRAALALAKLPAALRIVEEYETAGEPLLVFSAHKRPVELIAERPGWSLIHGGVSASKRTAIKDAFQAGEGCGVAMTIKAGGVGVTLTRAATVVLIDEEWSPALNEQAIDRAHRIGQTRAVQVIRLRARHVVDEVLAQVTGRKRRLNSALRGFGRTG